MKRNNRIIALLMIIIIAISSAYSVCMPVYASEHGGGGSSNHVIVKDKTKVKTFINDYFTDVADFWLYVAMQVGAVFVNKFDFSTFAENYKAMDSIINEENDIGIYEDSSGNVSGLYLSKEFMTDLKALLDQYAKEEQTKEENGGFYLLPTTKFSDLPTYRFKNSNQMKTFQNIMIEKGVLVVYFGYELNGRYSFRFADPFSDPDHPTYLVGDLSDINRLKNYSYMPVNAKFFCMDEWVFHNARIKVFPDADTIYSSVSEAEDYDVEGSNSAYLTEAYINFDLENHGSADSDAAIIYSTTGERMRVFVSQNAAKNYSVGKRKVYFTKNYYNYVPDDLTVTLDDLQKGLDDLQKLIEELLKRIRDDSREAEIEELLRLILEELRKQPSTGGGGGGTGGGDVVVNVDLEETNSWLSKIYSKVSKIFEKMNSAVEGAEDAALSKIQESLDEIIVQLKKIRRWAAVDTVIDGVDAIADWLDLIYDVLKNGAGSAVTALSSALEDSTDLMKQKFPFSIPWDILFFVSVLSAEPETPHFAIPLNFEYPALDLAVDYEMELDFTPLQWLSDLSRLLLSMTYAAGLMKRTLDIVSSNKEG